MVQLSDFSPNWLLTSGWLGAPSLYAWLQCAEDSPEGLRTFHLAMWMEGPRRSAEKPVLRHNPKKKIEQSMTNI